MTKYISVIAAALILSACGSTPKPVVEGKAVRSYQQPTVIIVQAAPQPQPVYIQAAPQHRLYSPQVQYYAVPGKVYANPALPRTTHAPVVVQEVPEEE